jgi:mannose-1-phosphate guanylyltransferase / mannose-6-phosphate isomerase
MLAQRNKVVPVILSGGSGTRLWPVSREDHPKQFYGLFDSSHSLMEDTLERVKDTDRFHPPIILGNQAHRFLIMEQLKHVGISSASILIEPCARNTGPAITAAAFYVKSRYPDSLMLVLPTDQYIGDADKFLEGVEEARAIADQNYLVTFGIKPEYPETGYGYIQRGRPLSERACTVAAFVEKPDLETSQRYVADGNYLWNSGIFLFPAQCLLDEMRHHNPDIIQHCEQALAKAHVEHDFVSLDEREFQQAPALSIDYGLMERTDRAALVPLECDWSDTGAWESVWRLSPKDSQGNVGIGKCHLMSSSNCYIRSEKGPAIATCGVDNLIIVATSDAVLVAHKDQAQSLKTLVSHIRKDQPQLIQQNGHVYRPWGMYESINTGPRWQVKLIHVNPGEKLSLQMHYHRAEHWVVVSGTAKVVCGDSERILTENQSIHIPHGCLHRIENPGKIDLQIIEVQSGSYLGEDDIVRFEDDYGRMSQAS